MKYDSIILNKCIEYIPNIIIFLINILKYVKCDGRVVFINRDRRYSDTCLMPSSSFIQAYNVWTGNERIYNDIVSDVMFHLTYNYDKPSYWNSYPVSDRCFYSIEKINNMLSEVTSEKRWFVPYWRFDMREFLFFVQGLIETDIMCLELEKIIPTAKYEDEYLVEMVKHEKGFIKNSQQKTKILDEIRDTANALYWNVFLEENDLISYYASELNNWKEEYYKLRGLYDGLLCNTENNVRRS